MKNFPETLTIGELAELSGYTERRIQQLSAESVIPKARTRGEYPAAKCITALFTHLRAEAAGWHGQKAEDLARCAKAKAEKLERDNAKAAGTLVEAEAVYRTYESVFVVLRQKIMGSDRLSEGEKAELLNELRSLNSRVTIG